MSRDKLSKSQDAGTKKYPRLSIDYRFRIREHEKDVMAFEYYDKEKEEILSIIAPLTGIFIGAVNALSCFAQDWGKNGGSYQSSFYLTNKDRIAIFDPSGKKVFAGNRDEIDSFGLSEGMEKFKVRKHIIILNEKSVVMAVETNMIIFIDRFNSFDKETFKDYLMVLTPGEFDIESNPINLSKRSIDFLGKFAKKNKPKFADMGQGQPLTDEMYEAYGGDQVVDMFIEWKKFMEKGSDDPGDASTETPEDDIKKDGGETEIGEPGDKINPDTGEVDDDLPF